MKVFLDAEELRQLTGYKMPAKQIAWLRRNGVPHFVNAAGRPVVAASLLEQRPTSAYALGPVR